MSEGSHLEHFGLYLEYKWLSWGKQPHLVNAIFHCQTWAMFRPNILFLSGISQKNLKQEQQVWIRRVPLTPVGMFYVQFHWLVPDWKQQGHCCALKPIHLNCSAQQSTVLRVRWQACGPPPSKFSWTFALAWEEIQRHKRNGMNPSIWIKRLK